MTGRALTVWIVVQAAVSVLAWSVPAIQSFISRVRLHTLEEAEVEGRADARVAMNDALDPVMGLLGRVVTASSARRRRSYIDQALGAVLATMATLLGSDRSRACWFKFNAGPPKTLTPDGYHGRSGSPSSVFVEGTTSGDAALSMALTGGDRICEDIDKEPPPGWDTSKTRDYKTFISVSVVAGDKVFGMLTLDSMAPGDLTDDDLRLLRLLAGALAVALASA